MPPRRRQHLPQAQRQHLRERVHAAEGITTGNSARIHACVVAQALDLSQYVNGQPSLGGLPVTRTGLITRLYAQVMLTVVEVCPVLRNLV